MSELTFLTKEQCLGNEYQQLDVVKKRGMKAAITDFSILLGGTVDDFRHIATDSSLKGRTGDYWTKSKGYIADVFAIDSSELKINKACNERCVGARIVLPFLLIDQIPMNRISRNKAEDGILEVEYGYYPQTAVSSDMQTQLEEAYSSGMVRKTGRGYTTDSRAYNAFEDTFLDKCHEEYEYNGKEYVRVEANSCYDKEAFTLSNGKYYWNGDFVWVEVEPVKWLIDERAKIMITEKIIFAGVQFNKNRNYDVIDFYKTNIKNFIDMYFSKDLVQARKTIILEKKTELTEGVKTRESIILEEETDSAEEVKTRKSRLQKLNPDKTRTIDRAKMTDTEIIQNWIEAGESVLLRGPSGIGKTERIRALYPDLIYMKLTNNMFPEKAVGSVNLQTGQSIPPDFAKTAIMQGATKEERKLIEENIQNIYDIADTIYERSKTSDKKVVIMLDELLNVKPAVQSLVYTLVLNRMVEIGKGLKLPDNVVVVATGNQKKYSSVAEDLAEPLEKRFDHILDMKPKVGEWITEYAIPKKLHPTVLGYMLLKYNSSGKSDDIKDIGYFYEEPEVGEQHLDANGCKGRTNDPRSWASISNTLYNFEKNLKEGKYIGKDVEDIFKRSLGSKLRKEWAAEFFDFYNIPVVTPERVVKGIGKGYTQADLPRDIIKKVAYMMALTTANENEVEACREFIRQNCDPEYVSIYDIYWSGDDERRIEILSEIQEMSIDMHGTKEMKEYAEDGAYAYGKIGTMYNEHLTRETREEVRGEENDR